MLKFYGYKKCSTCHKAEQFLQRASIAYEFIDITEHPPTAKELALIAQYSDTPLKKLFNTSGIQYRELNIKAQLPSLSDADILTLLAGNGRLIKRPLIMGNHQASVGFKEELFKATWL